MQVSTDSYNPPCKGRYAGVRNSMGVGARSMPDGQTITLDSRKGEGADRHVRFRSVSPLPEHIRFRRGSKEFCNARKKRLLQYRVPEGEEV